VLRTSSSRAGLDAETKGRLQAAVGKVEHTYSNGRKQELILSENGVFGNADLIFGKTTDLASYIAEEEGAGEEGMTVRGVGLRPGHPNLWPNRIVHYLVDGTFTSWELTLLHGALNTWNADSTLVTWQPAPSSTVPHVRFTRTHTGTFCGRSALGRTGEAGQLFELECLEDTHTILHEMGHAAGLEHEHQRCGRGAFVNVHVSADGRLPHPAAYSELCVTNRRNYGDYDYSSVMHYFETEFMNALTNPTGVFVGLPTNIGNATRLSQNDVNSLNQMYTNRTTPTTSGYAFAWSQGFDGSFSAHSSYSANSMKPSAPHVNVGTVGTGRYLVTLFNQAVEIGGNVQVTAYGGSPTRCKLESYGNFQTDLMLTVRCNDVHGTPTPSQFTISYQRTPSPTAGHRGGHLYSSRLREVGAYTPDHRYSWNSAGGNNRVTAHATGVYSVEFPGLNVQGGTVRVTAVGANSDYCTIGSWSHRGVNVNCFDTYGNPKDSAFSVALQESGFPGTFAYAWVDNPWANESDPSAFYQRSFIAGDGGGIQPTPIHVNRQGDGAYQLTIPGVPDANTSVNVAAYASNRSCRVASWFAGTPANGGLSRSDRRELVFVRCFAPDGTPADTQFAITFLSREIVVG
jgi:hypothetical protein